jgi:DNA-binding winged helix-turn-helix (wHTH) protein
MAEPATTGKAEYYYEFEDYRFHPDIRLLIRVRDGHPLKLMPKASALLLVLLKRCGEVITYEELKNEVWPDTPHVLTHTIRETKHALVKVLGEAAYKLETVAGKGYRFNVVAVERQKEGDTVEAADRDVPLYIKNLEDAGGQIPKEVKPTAEVSLSESAGTGLSSAFAGHVRHVVTSCAMYALLYVIALVVEIAYQYDRFGSSELKLAPLVFLWIFGTSVAGLYVAWRRVCRGELNGLYPPLLIYAGAGLLLYVVLGFFLPNYPITEASFQTYTAHGAYLKSVCYFIVLAGVFLIIPFHLVISLQREVLAGRVDSVLGLLNGGRQVIMPKGTVYLKVWWLGVLLIIVTVLSPILIAHLFENLKPHFNMNLFMQLVMWRTLLYLLLAMESLLWYSLSLNKLKRLLLEPAFVDQ